jgi:putative Mn2+ efflux pump MntP
MEETVVTHLLKVAPIFGPIILILLGGIVVLWRSLEKKNNELKEANQVLLDVIKQSTEGVMKLHNAIEFIKNSK